MPKWERIGHPIDTATVIACLLFLALAERTPTNEIVYMILASGSCLCVTKDEWVHYKLCGSWEMWLHGVLFMLHSSILILAYLSWEVGRSSFLSLAGVVFIFFLYEVIYWNFPRSKYKAPTSSPNYREMTKDDLYEYFGE